MPVRLDIINNLISTFMMDFLITFAPTDGRENYIIGRFPDLETSIDFAMALHRSSNVRHVILVIGPERISDNELSPARLILSTDNRHE